MDNPEMIRARGDGIDIQLALWKGEVRAILCVHGLTANCRCWDTMAAPLAPRHKLIALDLRGRGLSEKPPEGYFVDQHCRDIEAVIDHRLDEIARYEELFAELSDCMCDWPAGMKFVLGFGKAITQAKEAYIRENRHLLTAEWDAKVATG